MKTHNSRILIVIIFFTIVFFTINRENAGSQPVMFHTVVDRETPGDDPREFIMDAVLHIRGGYSQVAGYVTRDVYLGKSSQVEGKNQKGEVDKYVEIPDYPVTYGSLVSPQYKVGEFTFYYKGKPKDFNVTDILRTIGLKTVYIAVDNPGPDVSFRAWLDISLEDGSRMSYDVVGTQAYGDWWWSKSRGCAGHAAEVKLEPIFFKNEDSGKTETGDDTVHPVGYWPFNEGSGTVAHDQSINANHGKLYGTKWVKGIKKYAVSLDGKNDYIEIPDHASLNPLHEITIEAWYMPVSFHGTGNDPIIDKAYHSSSPPYYQYHLGVTGDQYDHQFKGSFLFMASIEGKHCNARTLGNAWKPGEWYFVAGTYDGHIMKIYVNGEDKTSRFYVDGISKSSSMISGRLDAYGRKMRFGKFVNIDKYLPGIIDEIKLYDHALSAATIKRHYREVTEQETVSEKIIKDTTPPSITIITPQSTKGIIVVEKGYRQLLTGQAKDQSGIAYVEINGMEAFIESIPGGVAFTGEVLLALGENEFVIEAMDVHKNTSRKKIIIKRSAVEHTHPEDGNGKPVPGYKPDLWIFSIGVSAYKNAAMNLDYADYDARTISHAFRKQQGLLFNEVHLNVLLNEQATRDNILTELCHYLGQAAYDDVVFIFVSGHGIKHKKTGSYYFLTHDATTENLISRGLKWSDFDEAVKIVRANVSRVLLFFDTCHAGAMQLATRDVDPGEDLAEALKESEGTYIFSASKAGEESFESQKYKYLEDDPGHGAFTYCLLEGLTGGKADLDSDNTITVFELFRYVSKRVPRLTKGSQHPYFKASGTDMPLYIK